MKKFIRLVDGEVSVQMKAINDTGKRWDQVKLKEKFEVGWRQFGFSDSDMVTEHYFHPTRRWRFDFAFPSLKVAVELDGMGYGHQAIKGRKDDNEKQNAAIELGWKVLRYDTSELSLTKLPETIGQVVNVLEQSYAEDDK